jgi:O-antigen ligase
VLTNPVIPNNHSLPVQVSKHLVTFCTVAVFLYALSRLWIGAKISAYFEAAFLLPFYYVVFKNWGYFKKQFLTWLVIAMLAIPILQFCVHYYQDPVLAMNYQGVEKLFRLTFFLAPAFWLAHNLKLVNWFILANVFGLITLVIIQPNSEALIKATLAGGRWLTGDINAALIALYAGITIIASASIFSQALKIKPITLRILASLTLIIIFIFSGEILFSTAIRASLVALILSAVCFIYMISKHPNYKISNMLKHPLKIVLASILGTLMIYGLLNSPLPNRFQSEINNVLKQQKSELTILPDSAGGGRGALWKFATSKTLERPIIGWGGEARKDLISNSEFLKSRTHGGLQHTHNAWLEFGLAYGLLGLLLIGTLIFNLIRLYLRHWKLSHIPSHIVIHSVIGLIFLSMMNLFESYLFFWQGGYLVIWIAAPAMAYIINKAPKMQHKVQPKMQHHKMEAP